MLERRHVALCKPAGPNHPPETNKKRTWLAEQIMHNHAETRFQLKLSRPGVAPAGQPVSEGISL
jgi:hypothetical protein